ncbi:MAG TPA: GNAT family N-acetyltransferase [Synergistales bacterium]|nr:GNAT family N-acetyltransferase [Synergistales bacterium]HRV72094.1 GNAT family N-acetyltransferase [Thermovirgaceae bacterium]
MKDFTISISDLEQGKRQAVRKSLHTIHGKSDEGPIVIRPFRSGELGWVSWRHCVLYREEYGFDDTFEYYLLAGMAQFIHEPGDRGQVWVVDCGGTVVGAISIVEISSETGQLRWFILEPGFRGLGLGKRLMETALAYCRERGMTRVFLWTVSELLAARRLYEINGFEMTETKNHFIWGREITEERWDLEL